MFELVDIFLINWIAVFFPWHLWCAVSVFFCDGKYLLEAIGNFEFGEIFLINLVADCFLRHELCAVSVFFMRYKVLA